MIKEPAEQNTGGPKHAQHWGQVWHYAVLAVSKARGMGFDAKLAWVRKLVLRELVSILNEMANIPKQAFMGIKFLEQTLAMGILFHLDWLERFETTYNMMNSRHA